MAGVAIEGGRTETRFFDWVVSVRLSIRYEARAVYQLLAQKVAIVQACNTVMLTD